MKVEVLKNPGNEDWKEVKRRALITIGKKPVQEPGYEWAVKMLRCRHSPIRYLIFSFLLTDIPYWLSTELCRHHVGIEKYVRSQRDDRNNSDIPRAAKPQGAFVDMIIDVNADALMTIMHKRLCNCATKEMRELMQMIKESVIKTNPEFKDFLVPMCKYIGRCDEIISCKEREN